MRTKHALLISFLLILELALTGCTRGGGRTDAQIASDIQSKIGADLRLANKQVSVQTKDGTVVLTGRVDTEAEKKMVETYAAGVAGVKTVMNNLEVAPASAQAAPPPTPEPPAPAPPAPPEAKKAAPAAKKATAPAQQPATPAATAAPPAPTPGAPSAPAPTAPSAPAATPPAEERVTMPAGTELTIRMIDSVDSEKNKVGDRFRATIEMPVVIEGKTVVPKGAEVEGVVAQSASAGHFQGRSELALALSILTYAGKSYDIKTEQAVREASSRGKKTAAMVGGGGALGAVIGGIAGGGKGAAIGAASGAGAGAGVQAVTKGQQVRIPSETVLEFKLKNPVTVTPAATAGRR
jgi:hypothetical protein